MTQPAPAEQMYLISKSDLEEMYQQTKDRIGYSCVSHIYDQIRSNHYTPTEDGATCIKCFDCGKQVSTFHKGIIFRAVATCPECIEKDIAASDKRIADAVKELESLEEKSETLKKDATTMNEEVYNDGKSWAYRNAIALLRGDEG